MLPKVVDLIIFKNKWKYYIYVYLYQAEKILIQKHNKTPLWPPKGLGLQCLNKHAQTVVAKNNGCCHSITLQQCDGTGLWFIES